MILFLVTLDFKCFQASLMVKGLTLKSSSKPTKSPLPSKERKKEGRKGGREKKESILSFVVWILKKKRKENKKIICFCLIAFKMREKISY